VLLSVAAAGGAHAPVSAAGLGDAYLAAAAIAGAASLAALIILPPARSFLPRLELAPSMSMH
jgi:long-subunit fatty acid transport protein